MEKYLVSARKYRPATFASVVGQKNLAATLKNSIATDRLAHAYLFCGSRGVGKTSCARIFAKTINCTDRTPDGEACNHCDSCRQFNENRSLNIIELDAASNNGVEDIRQLIDQVQIPPTDGRYRVFIVDEVHMLSSAAFNAFLKTLEEPPEYVIFILATTEKHKVIPTILSRCQIYDFNRITIADMVDHLGYVAASEGIKAEPAALNVIARKADGAMRDALSIFDQVAASSLNNITYASTIENLNVLDSAYYNRLLEAFLSGNIPDALLIYKEIRDHGFNNHFFLTGLADYFRDLVVARDPRTLELLESDDEHRSSMAELAARCTPAFLYKAMDLCNTAEMNYRTAANKQFLVELTLIKLCQAGSPSPDNHQGDGEGQKLRPIASPASMPAPTPAQPVRQQPAPPAAPTASPATATPKTTAAAPTRSGGSGNAGLPGPRISIRPEAISARAGNPAGNPSASSAATPHSTPASPANAAPYSIDDLMQAWDSFTDLHPTATALISTMRSCTPQGPDSDDGPGKDTYTVMVESQVQMALLSQALPEIRRHVCSRLGNDLINFHLKREEGRGSSQTWTDREVLTQMLADNEALRQLTEELRLTLD